jgi:hypothetical protein
MKFCPTLPNFKSINIAVFNFSDLSISEVDAAEHLSLGISILTIKKIIDL